jgi:AmmeMemoRadiSam system protein A
MIKEQRSGEWTPALTDAEKATLFAIAEDTLRACVEQIRVNLATYTLTDRLKVPTATFVTLNRHGHLRGCIGSLAPVTALFQSVHDNTIQAALQDHRFRPVTAAELAELEVRVSILSPIVPLESLADFHLGEHGIIVEKQGRRAVFLPEVALEQHWNKASTLNALCGKAGLPTDAWRAGADFSVFSSVVLTR